MDGIRLQNTAYSLLENLVMAAGLPHSEHSERCPNHSMDFTLYSEVKKYLRVISSLAALRFRLVSTRAGWYLYCFWIVSKLPYFLSYLVSTKFRIHNNKLQPTPQYT